MQVINLQKNYKNCKKIGIRYVKIQYNQICDTYPIDRFIEIKKELLENTKNVPQTAENDPDREKKIFTYLYIKVAQKIQYDEKASKACDLTGYERDAADKIINDASDLNGVLTGLSLCRGYSEILRNLVAEVRSNIYKDKDKNEGMQSIVVSGGATTRGERNRFACMESSVFRW